ncbi:MAG TPA: energy transducer TonB, partial [Nitrospiria bacterium]|nr:energy transducer TonB [Nitrospiria bacterium]
VKPPVPVKLEPPPPAPPAPQQLVVKAPVVSPEQPVAPPPPPSAPVLEASSAPPGPVQLTTELSVSCPKRSPPEYPALSRRMGEEGRVIVRVELDEQGRVDTAQIESSSGSSRLDAAALAAVKSWQCSPAVHDGNPVRAVALQPFLFRLKGR